MFDMYDYGKFVTSLVDKDILLSKKGYAYNIEENKLVDTYTRNKKVYFRFKDIEYDLAKEIMNRFVGNIDSDIEYKNNDFRDCRLKNLKYKINTIIRGEEILYIDGKVFKHIPDYRDCYWISDDGVLYSDNINDYMKKSVITDPNNPYGTYEVITLIPKDGYMRSERDKLNKAFIHVLVYKTFVGDIPKDYVVDHINTNKSNNRYNNLEAVTSKENSKRSAIYYGKLNGNGNGKVYTDFQIHELCKLMQSTNMYSSEDILNKLNIPYSSSNVKQLNDVIEKIKSKKSFRYISDNYDIENFSYKVSTKSITKAKLTESDVKQIWIMLKNNPNDIKTIADKFNVHPASIKRIRDKETWTHITNYI